MPTGNTNDNSLLRKPGKFAVFILVLFFMLLLSFGNLVFTNALGETCGIAHPYIFQVDVSSIDMQTGTKAPALINTIPTSSLNENFDTYLRVYDDSGTLVDSNDDFAGALTSRIENFPIQDYDTIVIEVATFADAGTGEYLLSVEPIHSRRDTPSFSMTIDGEEYTQPQMFEGELEVGDWHEYAFSANQPVNIGLIGLEADNEDILLDTFLTIYDDEGEFVESHDNFDSVDVSSGIYEFPAQDFSTVNIEVATFDDSLAGTYYLIITPVQQDPFDLIIPPDPDLNYRDSELEGTSAQGKIIEMERVRYTVASRDIDADFIEIRLVSAEETTNFGSEYLFLRRDPSAPVQWSSCVDHYGYVDDKSFTLNRRGLDRFGQGISCNPNEEGCRIDARITLNFFGQMMFYLILPGLVIILPFIGILAIRDAGGAGIWFMILVFVAIHVLTSSLLYVHLATVSGIEALANFAYGILAGAATGSAIAFMDKVLDKFKDAHAENPPPSNNNETNNAASEEGT